MSNTPILTQKRVSNAEILDLMKNASLKDLGIRATQIRDTLHPTKTITFVVDRNINYTNICWVDCKFCAFKRKINENETYFCNYLYFIFVNKPV